MSPTAVLLTSFKCVTINQSTRTTRVLSCSRAYEYIRIYDAQTSLQPVVQHPSVVWGVASKRTPGREEYRCKKDEIDRMGVGDKADIWKLGHLNATTIGRPYTQKTGPTITQKIRYKATRQTSLGPRGYLPRRTEFARGQSCRETWIKRTSVAAFPERENPRWRT